MKLAFFADLHARGSDLDAFQKQFTSALNVAVREGAGAIFIAGDTFDASSIQDKHGTTGGIGSIVQACFALALDPPRYKQIYVIDGNHDKRNDASESANMILAPLDNVKVITEPLLIRFGKIGVCCVPWFYTRTAQSAIDEALEQAAGPFDQIALCAHMEITGSRMNGGQVCEHASFGLTSAELQAYEFDHVALGHFHARQDVANGRGGYVGALRQLGFGHAEEPQGFEIYDSETDGTTWYEIDEAPRHHVYVWRKGEPRPVLTGDGFERIRPEGFEIDAEDAAELAGAEIVPIVQRAEPQRRIANIPDGILQDMHGMLDLWLGAQADEHEAPALHECLSELLSLGALTEGGIERITGGGTLRILRTSIRGFGPHRNKTIDWTNHAELVALLAPNGSGKTFLLEADPACLFGEFPSYPGSLYQNMTQDGDGDAELVSEFEYNGSDYRVTRSLHVTAKTKSHKATLEKWSQADAPGVDGSEWKVVAGPKATDTQQAVIDLIGSKDAALASWFSGQGGRGDFCMIPTSKRREVASELLGHTALDDVSDRAKTRAAELRGEAQAARTRLDNAPDYPELIQDTTAKRDTAAQALHKAEEEIQAYDTTIDRHKSDLAALTQRLERANETGSIRKELETEKKALETFSAELAAAEAARTRLPDLEAAASRLDKGRSMLAAFDTHRAWVSSVRQLDLQNETAEGRIARYTPSDDEKGRIDSLPKMRESVGMQTIKRASLMSRLKELSSDMATALIKVKAVEGKEPPAAPAGDVCLACDLFQAANKDFDDIDVWRERLRAAEDEATKVEAEEQALQATIAQVRMEIQELEKRQKEISDNAYIVEADTGVLKANNTELAKLRANEPPEPVGITDATERAAREAINKLELAVRDAPAVRERAARVPALTEQIQRQTNRVDALREKIANAENPVDVQVEIDKANTALTRSNELRKMAQQALSEKTDLLARYSADLERYEKEQAELAAVNDTLASTLRRVDHFKTLQAAFGRSGAQALLLDASMADLEEEAHTLVQDATDRQFAIEIKTLVDNEGGGQREDLAIMACDHRGRRDITQFSGGERKLFQIVMRLAMSKWIARLTGRSAGMIRIDEAFDALDADRVVRVIELLQQQGDNYGQIVLVTHNPALASYIPDQIVLELPKGVTVATAESDGLDHERGNEE